MGLGSSHATKGAPSRQVVPWIADQLIPAKDAWMGGNDFALGHDANLVCGGADGDGLTGRAGGNAVAITIHPDQAGGGDTHHLLDITIKAGGDGAKQRLFVGKAGGDGTRALHGMAALREFLAAGGEPAVQIGEGGKARQGREEPLPNIADLVLHLPLLPAGGGRTGDRLEQVVIGQCQETPVELTFFAYVNSVDYSLA